MKYTIILLRKEYNNYIFYKKISIKSFNLLNEFVKIDKDKSIHVDFSNPIYQKGNEKFYFYLENGNCITLKEKEALISTRELDSVISEKLFREILKSVADNTKDKIINIIIGAIFGGLIVAIILIMYYQGQIQAIYNETMQKLIENGGWTPV